MASIKFPKTLIPFTIGTGPGSIPEVTKELVGWHYNDLKDYAQTWSDLAEGFITNIKNTVNSISDINTTIPVPDWNGDIPIDLIGLIGEMPENPITASDYLIKIPDELLWNYEENIYVSELLIKLKERLQDIIVNGGSALADVEDDIFARETERDLLINEDAKTKAADNWAKRNFQLPGVGLFSSILQIDTEYQNKMLDKARSIAEESRKAEIQMEQNAFDNSNKIEATSMDYNIKLNANRIAAAQAIVQYGLAIMNASIQLLEAKVKSYALIIQAYAARIDAFKSIADIYIAKMDAEIKYILAQIQAASASLDAEVKEMQVKYGLILDADKVQAQISSQIAAGAMSAFHASAGLSSGFSASLGQSESISEDYSQNEEIKQ